MSFLHVYEAVLTTVGPVFVGSGSELKPKETIKENKRLKVVDIYRLYAALSPNQRKKFELFMLDQDLRLEDWVKNMKLQKLEALGDKIIKCVIPYSENSARNLKECIKDAFGRPYIPGTTLKGMIRSLLLGAEIMTAPDRYSAEASKIVKKAFNTTSGRADKTFLQTDCDDLETKCFHRLPQGVSLKEVDLKDAVCDTLRGVIISDSDPLPEDTLIWVPKIDVAPSGSEKSCPILRECIRPGSSIRFTITIDTSLNRDVTAQKIMEAVRLFDECYSEQFLKYFSGVRGDLSSGDYVYVGGGSGFAAKSMIYALTGDHEECLEATKGIFRKTLSRDIYEKHGHDKDFPVSPHKLKCTRVRNELLQMGLCRLALKEISV